MGEDTANYATILTLSVGVVVGLAMLLLGSRLVRLACGLMGLVLGAAGGVAGAAILGSSQWATLAIVVVAGVIGVVVATVLFRVWASVSAGLVMGVTAAVAAGWLMQPDVVTLGGASGGAATGAALVAEGEDGGLDGVLSGGIPTSEEARERLGEATDVLIDRATTEARERLGSAADSVSKAIRDRIDGAGTSDEPAADDAEGAAADATDPTEDADGMDLGIDAEDVRDDLLAALDGFKSASFAWVAELWGELDGQS
ncbi:MAG: hypothetical protein AAGB29_14225, partial [Planctomycetota bacterium]